MSAPDSAFVHERSCQNPRGCTCKAEALHAWGLLSQREHLTAVERDRVNQYWGNHVRRRPLGFGAKMAFILGLSPTATAEQILAKAREIATTIGRNHGSFAEQLEAFRREAGLATGADAEALLARVRAGEDVRAVAMSTPAMRGRATAPSGTPAVAVPALSVAERAREIEARREAVEQAVATKACQTVGERLRAGAARAMAQSEQPNPPPVGGKGATMEKKTSVQNILDQHREAIGPAGLSTAENNTRARRLAADMRERKREAIEVPDDPMALRVAIGAAQMRVANGVASPVDVAFLEAAKEKYDAMIVENTLYNMNKMKELLDRGKKR